MSRPKAYGAPVDAHETVLESQAYPALPRLLALTIIAVMAGFSFCGFGVLRSAGWSVGSLVLLPLAALSAVWTGYWIVYSRTRLEGDVLSQTWLWNRRAEARDVTQLKLVHWPLLKYIVAPRLMVRRRNGSIAWFHSADPKLLTDFALRVARQSARRASPRD